CCRNSFIAPVQCGVPGRYVVGVGVAPIDGDVISSARYCGERYCGGTLGVFKTIVITGDQVTETDVNTKKGGEVSTVGVKGYDTAIRRVPPIPDESSPAKIMKRLILLARRSNVGAIDVAADADDCLGIREVVICGCRSIRKLNSTSAPGR